MRYRVTVEVDTPQGLKVGSSVWEVITSRGPGFPGPEAGGLNYRIKGEAVTVDLPDGTLFAVTTSADGSLDYPAYVVEGHLRAHPDPAIQLVNGDWRENRRRIRRSKVRLGLTEDEYPMLVYFRDIDDPTTVQRVDPLNLSAIFGTGVRLRRIMIAITEDAITRGIAERLTWLGSQRGSLVFDGRYHGEAPEKDLTVAAFTQG